MIVKPKGRIVRRIVVEVDHNNVVHVEATDIVERQNGSKFDRVPVQTDTRHWVILLSRVVADYTMYLFEYVDMRAAQHGKKQETETSGDHDDQKRSDPNPKVPD